MCKNAIVLCTILVHIYRSTFRQQIAVCTSDGRRATERTLASLGLIDDVSAVACGDDDTGGASCPLTHLCDVTGVATRDAVMVGDTQHDLSMGVDAGELLLL